MKIMENSNCHNSTSIFFLCFHYLKRDDEYKRIYGYPFEVFKKYIDFLKKEYAIISFEDLKLFFNNKKRLPERCAILTFDDGLSEQARIIAPFLAKNNIKALFCPPACTFNNEMAGTQIIHFVTAKYGIKNFYKFLQNYFSVTGLIWDEYFDNKALENEKDILRLYSKLKEILLFKLPYQSVSILLQAIYHNILFKDDPDIMYKVYFNINELKEIAELGHEIGCHTYSHFLFTQRNLGDNDWQAEIGKSKEILESIINKKVDIFAYPFGGRKENFNFSLWTKKLKEAGFKFALNANKHIVSGSQFNPFWIERYSVQSTDSCKDIIIKAYTYKL